MDASQRFTSGAAFNDRQFSVGAEGALVRTDAARRLDDTASSRDIERGSKSLDDLFLGVEDDQCKESLDEIETVLLERAVHRAHGNVAALWNRRRASDYEPALADAARPVPPCQVLRPAAFAR